MNLNKKIILLSIFIIFIFVSGAYSMQVHQNTDEIPVISNETDAYGCCSVIWQLDGNDTVMGYRRDSNLTADIHIDKINWHGIPAIKQSKSEGGEFTHVIITSNGWVIGLGGIDDGIDNQICENITANMINKDNNISKSSLAEIQKIKKPYKKGHVVIKAPNGNYGFANVDKLKTGKLQPGQYISIPNAYSYSRGGNLSLNTPDKIKAMSDLTRSDLFGLDRREIVTYYFNSTDEGNFTDIYVSNDDGSLFDFNNTYDIDDIYLNGNITISGFDIPAAPDYAKLGTISFLEETSNLTKLITLIAIVAFVVIVGILFFAVLRFVRFIKFKIRR
jgi:hypothetical protein